MLPGVVHFLFKVLQSSFNKRRKQCHAFFFSFPPGLGFIFILSLTTSFFLYWIALLFQRFTQRWWFFLFPPFFSPHTFSLPICPTVYGLQTCCLHFSSPMLSALFLDSFQGFLSLRSAGIIFNHLLALVLHDFLIHTYIFLNFGLP